MLPETTRIAWGNDNGHLPQTDHAWARGGVAVSRARAASGWLVTPIQGVLGRRSGLKYRLYFGAGGLAFGLLLGVVQGIKIGHQRGDHAAPTAGSGGAGPASARSSRAGIRSFAGRAYRPRPVANPSAAVEAASPTRAAAQP